MVFRFVARLCERFRAPRPRSETTSLAAKIATWENMMREYEALEMPELATRCRERAEHFKKEAEDLSNNAA